VVVGFGFATLTVMAVYGVLRLGSLRVGPWTLRLVFPVILVLLACSLLMAKFLQFGWGDRIRLRTEADQITMIHLDRLDLLTPGLPGGIGFFLGFAIGLQASGLYFHAGHCGLDITGGWWDCVTLSFDNLFHGLVLGSADAYDLRLGDRPEHTLWSAIIFFAFRLTYDGYFLVLLIALYQRHKVVHLMTYADDLVQAPTPVKLVEYLRHVCYRSTRWGRSFEDEFVFLCLTEKYLSGKDDDCRALSEVFADLE